MWNECLESVYSEINIRPEEDDWPETSSRGNVKQDPHTAVPPSSVSLVDRATPAAIVMAIAGHMLHSSAMVNNGSSERNHPFRMSEKACRAVARHKTP